jgi:hypothetical protein
MATQALLSRGSILRLGTVASAAAPVDGVTLPHYTMSPMTPTGLLTTGLAIGLKAPAAGAAAGTFSIVAWILNPVTRAWFAFAAAALDYNEALVSFDVNACALYFQIEAASVTTPGDVDLHLWEQ